jgi:hypothetical protein
MTLRYLDTLGMQATDSVTGFTGTIVAVTEWLNGCVRFNVQPNGLNKDGKPIEVDWFDSDQVIIRPRKKSIVSKTTPSRCDPCSCNSGDPCDE